MGQLNLFSMDMKTTTLENRTDGQVNKKIAYDVGATISGSRKEQARLRKLFEQKQTSELLIEIENTSTILAAELISKSELFSSFSLEIERENGVDPKLARLKQLLIQRIDAKPKDNKDCRKHYFHASQGLLHLFTTLKEWGQLQQFIDTVGTLLRYEKYSIEELEEQYRVNEENILETNPEIEGKSYRFLIRRRAKLEIALKSIREFGNGKISILGNSFVNFFTNQSSLNSTIKAASKIETWDELLGKKQRNTTKSAKKPVWERELPERPDRRGGRVSTVEKPEQLIELFGFAGVQFGHYVEDEKGFEHIYRCSEALYDLSDILQVSDQALSLNRRLSLAFGARGRGGSALAHYERHHKCINFTKVKGTLGVFCHEFAHALDNFLYDASHNFKNGQSHYLSELETIGENLPTELVNAMRNVMYTIKGGSAVAYFLNENTDSTVFKRTTELRRVYRESEGILHAMESIKERLDNRYAQKKQMISYYRSFNHEKELEKIQRTYKRDLKKWAQALAWLHEQETGERIEKIPYPSDSSRFLLNAMDLDGSRKKYWASDCELFARAFESYIEDKLHDENRRSDYLVAGTKDGVAYPVREERKRINLAMDSLIKEIRQYFNRGKLNFK